MDETYVKVAGRWRYVYRAVDQHCQVIDVYVSPHRATLTRAGARSVTTRGSLWLGVDAHPSRRVAAAFTELAEVN